MNKKRCYYLGREGSFSYLVAIKNYPDCQLMGKRTIRDIVQVLSESDLAVIPFENTLTGPIHENKALLQEYSLRILMMVREKIELCLISSETDIKAIHTVYSHPIALAQCARFFKNHPQITAVESFDTASAAYDLSTCEAAIASRESALQYSLNVLLENIQDTEENYTTFAFVTKNE